MSSPPFIQWKDLTLTHKKTQKVILNSLQGKVRCGQFLTIMGQSGAGKSSLLSILTGRLTRKTSAFELSGQVLMNGQKYDSKKFSKLAVYVRQDDILMGTLTVEETFDFQAKLKLHQKSNIEHQFKINQIIKKLNLEQCRKTLVGGQFSKSISGGQRKRVAIGVQLLADPNCLILDEPTSGLDSYNSLKIMKILKKLADDGKVIITTIHQPSSLMFQQMHRLILLSKGSTIYMGQAKQIVRYMISLGIKVNIHMNPADFFMLEVSQFSKSRGYNSPMTAQRFKQLQVQQESSVSQPANSQLLSNITQAYLPPILQQANQISLMKQFPILFKRSFKNYFRTISNLYGKLLILLIIPFMMVVLYGDVGNQFPEEFDYQALLLFLTKIGAFLFMLVFFNFGMNVYDTVLGYPSEKELVIKQTSSRLYSLGVYYICRCLIEIPIAIATGVVSTTIIYFLTGLDPHIDYFARFTLLTALISISGFMFGSMVGILFQTSQHAIQILPIIIMPVIVFGGLVVNLKTMPDYSRWIQYLSPIRHCYSALILDQLSTQKMHNIIQYEEIRDLMGVNGEFWVNVGYLAAIIAVLTVGSLSLLYIKKRPI